jgi:hypothetical protein
MPAVAHSSRTAAGRRSELLQFTTVPPPTALPALIEIQRSSVAVSPRSRKSAASPSSSGRPKPVSSTRRARSRTITRQPAAASRAATTPPPAPEPITQASTSIVSPGLGVRTRSGVTDAGSATLATNPERARYGDDSMP